MANWIAKPLIWAKTISRKTKGHPVKGVPTFGQQAVVLFLRKIKKKFRSLHDIV